MTAIALFILSAMDPHVRKEFDEIRALLADIAKRQDRAEKRAIAAEKRDAAAEKRLDRAEKRMDRWEAQMRARDSRVDARFEKHDKQIQATRRLVEPGIKILMQLVKDVREIKQTLWLMVEVPKNGQREKEASTLPLGTMTSLSTQLSVNAPRPHI